MKVAETKLKGQELIVSKRENNVKEEEEKIYSTKTYLNIKETNLTKRELIISNQDKIIFEVEEQNKSLEKDVKKFKHMEIEFKALKTACGLD